MTLRPFERFTARGSFAFRLIFSPVHRHAYASAADLRSERIAAPVSVVPLPRPWLSPLARLRANEGFKNHKPPAQVAEYCEAPPRGRSDANFWPDSLTVI